MADEGTVTQSELQVSIPLTDDSIDEADNETFIVKLEIASAVNRDLITVEPASSKCIIIDNDCEYKLARVVGMAVLFPSISPASFM